MGEKSWIQIFPKSISEKGNVINPNYDLILPHLNLYK